LARTSRAAVAGLSGEAYQDPQRLTEAFHTAMLVTAVLAILGGALAWLTIRNDALERPADDQDFHSHCGVDGPSPRPSSPRERLEAAARAAGMPPVSALVPYQPGQTW